MGTRGGVSEPEIIPPRRVPAALLLRLLDVLLGRFGFGLVALQIRSVRLAVGFEPADRRAVARDARLVVRFFGGLQIGAQLLQFGSVLFDFAFISFGLLLNGLLLGLRRRFRNLLVVFLGVRIRARRGRDGG